ncbi:hypothetical protein RI367_007048 [Sorochytrium milnesiophthora]
MTRDPHAAAKSKDVAGHSSDDGFEQEQELMPGVFLSKRKQQQQQQPTFEDTIKDMDAPALQDEHARLLLSVRQMQRSNDEMRRYQIEHGDDDMAEHIGENERVLGKTAVKLRMLEKQLLSLGVVVAPPHATSSDAEAEAEADRGVFLYTNKYKAALLYVIYGRTLDAEHRAATWITMLYSRISTRTAEVGFSMVVKYIEPDMEDLSSTTDLNGTVDAMSTFYGPGGKYYKTDVGAVQLLRRYIPPDTLAKHTDPGKLGAGTVGEFGEPSFSYARVRNDNVIQTAALHEFLHNLGAEHEGSGASIMAPTIHGGPFAEEQWGHATIRAVEKSLKTSKAWHDVAAAYIALSVAILSVNKQLSTRWSFHAVEVLFVAQMAGGLLLSVLLHLVGWIRLESLPSLRSLGPLVPLAAAYLFNVFLSMVALDRIDLALYNSARRTVVIFVLVFDYIMTLALPSRRAAGALALSTLGTVFACADGLHGDVVSLAVATVSNMATAVYMVLIRRNNVDMKLAPMDLYFRTNLLCLPVMLAYVVASGRMQSFLASPELIQGGVGLGGALALSVVTAFGLNYVIYLNTVANSPMGQCVAAQMRDCLILLVGLFVITNAKPMSALTVVGLVCSLVGGIWYSYITLRERQPVAPTYHQLETVTSEHPAKE